MTPPVMLAVESTELLATVVASLVIVRGNLSLLLDFGAMTRTL